MAGRETVGAVVVMIDGDASPLLAKYAQAESASRAAGTRIATALGSGFQSSTGLVDQFGKSIQTNAIAPLAAAEPVAQRTAVAFRSVGDAAGRSVTQYQATSAALRTLEGGTQGSLRAAERFLSVIPGVGSALSAAFPIVGAIALTEIISRLIGKFGDASEEVKKFHSDLQQIDTDIARIGREIESANVRAQTAQFGRAAGDRLRGIYSQQQLESDQDHIRIIQSDITRTQELLAQANKANSALGGMFGLSKLEAKHIFGLDSEQLGRDLQTQQAKLDAANKQIEADQANMNADRQEENKASAEDAKRTAEEIARAQKQRMEEIARASKAFHSQMEREAKESAEAQKRTIEEFNRSTLRDAEEAAAEGQRVFEENYRLAEEQTREAQRNTQENIRTSGERVQVSDASEKARVEAVYAQQIVHSKQDELSYAQAIAAIDEQSIRDKIESLQALKEYQESQSLTDEANKTDLEIEREKAALIRQEAQDTTAIARAQQQASVSKQGQAQIKQALDPQALVGQVSQDIGTSIADSIIEKHPGKSIGQELAQTLVQSLRQTAAQLVGNVLSGLLKVGIGGLLGFAGGGRPPVGVPSVVGERGPELFVPDVPGVIMPSVPTSGAFGIGTAQLTSSLVTNSASQSVSVGAIHLHGVRDMQDVARRLPDVLKARSPVFSPASK